MSNDTFKILVCGCFDMFHVGHLMLLKGAAAFGEVHVRIGDDESIMHMHKKGIDRPICTADDRQQILEACRYVASVGVFSFHEDPVAAHAKLLDALNPDMYAEGPDHGNVSLYPLLTQRGIPRLIIPDKVQGTTDILAKITRQQDPEDTCDVWNEITSDEQLGGTDPLNETN